MKKSPRINLKQREQFLIVISFIGILGSIFVFSSYAGQSLDTTKEGIYPVNRVFKDKNFTDNQLIVDKNNTFESKIKTKSGLTYCILGWNSDIASVRLTLGGKSNSVAKESYQDSIPREIICVKAVNSLKEAKITIRSNQAIQIKSLEVRR